MIKNKIFNHLMKSGKKNTSEKILSNTAKKIQKESKKQFKKIIQTVVINSIPLFRINTIIKKKKKRKKSIKEIPSFIKKNSTKISMGIKFIILSARKYSLKIANNLKQEILDVSNNEGLTLKRKEELQKKVILNKNYLLYYRW